MFLDFVDRDHNRFSISIDNIESYHQNASKILIDTTRGQRHAIRTDVNGSWLYSSFSKTMDKARKGSSVSFESFGYSHDILKGELISGIKKSIDAQKDWYDRAEKVYAKPYPPTKDDSNSRYVETTSKDRRLNPYGLMSYREVSYLSILSCFIVTYIRDFWYLEYQDRIGYLHVRVDDKDLVRGIRALAGLMLDPNYDEIIHSHSTYFEYDGANIAIMR